MPVFNLDACLPALASYFAGESDVLLAYIFGSQASGRAGPLSDLDVAVLLGGSPAGSRSTDRRLDFVGDLTERLHSDDVDVVVLNVAPLALRYRVIRDGKLVFARDRRSAVDYRSETLSLYFDFEPLLRRSERAFFQRILRGRFLDGYDPYRDAIQPDSPVPAPSQEHPTIQP